MSTEHSSTMLKIVAVRIDAFAAVDFSLFATLVEPTTATVSDVAAAETAKWYLCQRRIGD